MNSVGLRVTVQGDLPQEAMDRIAQSVSQTVLREVAELDIAPPLREVPFGGPESARAGADAQAAAGPDDELQRLRNWLIPMGIILQSEPQ